MIVTLLLALLGLSAFGVTADDSTTSLSFLTSTITSTIQPIESISSQEGGGTLTETATVPATTTTVWNSHTRHHKSKDARQYPLASFESVADTTTGHVTHPTTHGIVRRGGIKDARQYPKPTSTTTLSITTTITGNVTQPTTLTLMRRGDIKDARQYPNPTSTTTLSLTTTITGNVTQPTTLAIMRRREIKHPQNKDEDDGKHKDPPSSSATTTTTTSSDAPHPTHFDAWRNDTNSFCHIKLPNGSTSPTIAYNIKLNTTIEKPESLCGGLWDNLNGFPPWCSVPIAPVNCGSEEGLTGLTTEGWTWTVTRWTFVIGALCHAQNVEEAVRRATHGELKLTCESEEDLKNKHLSF